MRKRGIDSEMWTEIVRQNQQLESKSITQEARDLRVEALQKQAADAKSQIDQSYQRKLDAQTDLSRRLASLSPAAGHVMASAEIANTGLGHYRRSLRSFKQYREAFDIYATNLRSQADGDHLASDWFRVDNIPSLQTADPPLSETLGSVTLEISLLLALHLLFAAAAWVGFLRFDVR